MKRYVDLLTPILYAVFAVLSLVSLNTGAMPLGFAARALVVVPLGAAVVLLACLGVYRRIDKAVLAATLVVCVIFMHGHVLMLLESATGSDLGVALVLVEGLAVAAASVALARRTAPLEDYTRLAGLLAYVLVGVALATLLWMAVSSSEGVIVESEAADSSSTPVPSALDAVPPAGAGDAGARRPDVYYIVLDGYGREDMLAEVMGIDNSGFVAELERRGFFVAGRGRSNYSQTILSVASSLNSEHLHEPGQAASKLKPKQLHTMIKRSAAVRALKRRGYAFAEVPSGFGTTSPMEDVDRVLGPKRSGGLNEFEVMMIDLTPFRPLIDALFDRRVDMFERHRQTVLDAFENLPARPPGEQPWVVVAHIVAPHPPFVFDAEGRMPAQTDAWSRFDGVAKVEDRSAYQRGYAAQLEYLNRRVLAVVDEILARSGPDNLPVIILQGDHGPASLYATGYDPAFIRERMAILNAYFIPPDVHCELYDTITPVNTFRVLFNGLFDARLPLAPDESHFSSYGTQAVRYKLVDEAGNVVEQRPG
jgi:hypothetical protein